MSQPSPDTSEQKQQSEVQSSKLESKVKADNQSAMLKALIFACVVITAFVGYLFLTQSSAQKLETFERQAQKIQQLQGDDKKAALSALFKALDLQLVKDPKQLELANFGVLLAHEYADTAHQIDYLAYIDRQKQLTRDQRVSYIKLNYQTAGNEISLHLEPHIATILTQEPRQPDMMLMLAQEAFEDNDFATAVKGFEIAIEGLHGEELVLAKTQLAEARSKL